MWGTALGGWVVSGLRAILRHVEHSMMHEEIQALIRRQSDLLIEEWFARLVSEYGLLHREAYRVLQAAFDAGLKDVRDSYPNP